MRASEMILNREVGLHGRRSRPCPNFHSFVLSRSSASLAQRIARERCFNYEPESRRSYADQLALDHEDRELYALWESYLDGDDDAYEYITLVGGSQIYVAIYRHWSSLQISRGDRLGKFGPPRLSLAYPGDEVRVDLAPRVVEALLDNRRLAKTMLADLELCDVTLAEDPEGYLSYEIWAPSGLRGLAVKAAIEVEVNASVTSLAKLNMKMRTQLEGATAIYCWYDTANTPIYYGITGDLAYRQATHARSSEWSRFAARCDVARAATRRAALAEERRLILRDMPIFNRQHNDTLEARDRYMLYLAAQGRLDLAA